MGQADHTQQVAESILCFFPGFEAFKLPPPSVSEEVMKNQSSLIAGGSTIHALLAITTCKKNHITKILQQQDSESSNCDASNDSDPNKRPYACDAMSVGCIIVRT